MSTIINLPARTDLGSGQPIGEAISRYADRELQRQQHQQRLQLIQKSVQAMKAAGSKEKALEIAMQLPLQDANDLHTIKGFLDDMYPAKDETPVLTEAFSADTGLETKAYVPRKDLPKLNTPTGLEAVFGPGKTLSKPETAEFFSQDSKGKLEFVGKKRLEQRGPGELTKAEISEQHRVFHDQTMARAAERQAGAAERSANTADRAEGSAKLHLQMAYKNSIADMLNIKKTLGADGSFQINLSDEQPEKVAQYYNAIKGGDALLQKHGGNLLEAISEAQSKYGIGDKKPEPTPEPPTKRGGISGLFAPATPAATKPSSSPKASASPAERGTKENPHTPKTKAELDKVPKGEVYQYNGQLYTKN